MPSTGECRGGLVAEGLVWSVVVVVVSPVFEQDLRLVERVERLHLEQFASQMPVEGLDVGVLPGCAWLDVAGTAAAEAAAVAERLGDEFGAVVATDVLRRWPVQGDEVGEDVDGLVGVDRAGRNAGERLAGVLVADVQDLDRPAVSGLVEEVVECPELVGTRRGDRSRRPRLLLASPCPARDV
jgi:hypothetical protein